MIFDLLHAYRLKRPQSDVERDLRRLNATIPYAPKNLGRKVQPSSRRGYRTACPCIDGLIAIPIPGTVRPIDIGRQRYMPQLLDQIEEIRHGRKSYPAFAKRASGYDFRLQLVVIALVVVGKEQPLAHTNFSPWPDQAFPFIRLRRYLPGQQYLDSTLEKVANRRILRA